MTGFNSEHVNPIVSSPVTPQISMGAAWSALELTSVTAAQHVPYQGATVLYKNRSKKGGLYEMDGAQLHQKPVP